MRFFKYSLIFVSTCVLVSALPAAKSRKSLKRSTEVPESLPKIEATEESKDNNRTKKATTFCVEIKDGETVQKNCESVVPKEPMKVEPSPPPPPPEPTFLIYQPPEQQESISYVDIPIPVPIIHKNPSPPQLIVHPGGYQPQPNSLESNPCLPGSGYPGWNNPSYPPRPGSPSYPPHFGPGLGGPGSPPHFPSRPNAPVLPPSSGPGANKPVSPSGKPGTSGPNSPMVVPGPNPNDCADGSRPGYPGYPGYPAIAGPGGNVPNLSEMNRPGFPSVPGFPSIPGVSGCTCTCPEGDGHSRVYAFSRNSMNEQDDMMMSGMDQRMAGMMPMGMDPMPSEMATMDMRTQMEPMTDASGMQRTHLHHYHHSVAPISYSVVQPAVQPVVHELVQPVVHPISYSVVYPVNHPHVHPVHHQLQQPCADKSGSGVFRETFFSEPMRAATNENQGMMGDMQSMGPMEMQRASHQVPQIVVTPSHSSHLHPGQHAGNPCNESKAKHWQIRSTDVASEDNGDAKASVAQEAPADSSAKAQLSPSQMLNQMRAASPVQRIMQDDAANVQMSVIGPGGQTYLLGGGKSELDGEDRREELNKREIEVNNNKLE